MGRDLIYRPGEYYRVDDRTGFVKRAKRTYKEWTGVWVDRDRYEYRQPQDFVTGVVDDPRVEEPRVLSPDPLVGFLQTVTTALAKIGSNVIRVQSTLGMGVGDNLAIILDNNDTFFCKITGIGGRLGFQASGFQNSGFQVGGAGITISPSVPWPISTGNWVNDLSVI